VADSGGGIGSWPVVRWGQSATVHSYSFIEVTCQNARTYIIYSDVSELYELKKFIGLCTLRIVNMLVELNHKTRQRIKSYV